LADLQQARRLINEAQPHAAREVVEQVLREDENNVEAWRLAVTLARTDEERTHAEDQLKRALQHQQGRAARSQVASVPQAQHVSSNGVVVKDYLVESIFTLILYYLGFFVAGIVANIIFLNSAKEKEASGAAVKNIGCLQWLLWVHLGLIAAGMLFACVFFLLPIVFVSVGSLFGAG